MIKKKLIALAMAGTVGFTTLASPTLLAEATPSTISEFDELISELTSEQNEVSNELAQLQANITENEAEAEELVSEMRATEDLLASLRLEIEDLKEIIRAREVHLDEQARALQVIGEAGNIVHFVLNAESLNDVIGRIDVVSNLISQNKKTIQSQEDDKALVETKETETVEKQEEQMQLAAKLEENKALLEEQEAEQEAVLASIAAERSVAQGERDTLIAQAQAAEARRAELQTIRTASSNTQAVTPASSSSSSSETAATASTSTPAPATPAPAPAPAANNGSVIGIAHSLSGIPYSYGGTTVNGFDCSGFTSYVFRQAGRSLPRTAAGQYAGTSRVSRGEAQPGDLVFFNQGGGIDHVGIYLGGGNFIGSQYNGVVVSTINSGYWANYVVGFGR